MPKSSVYVEKINVEVVNQTCSACPSQWDALTDGGDELYVRYRWGYLEVSWGVMGEKIYGENLGDNLDGFLTYEQLVARTGHIINWPETCSDEPGPLFLIDLSKGTSKALISESGEEEWKDGTNTSDDKT